MTPGTSHNTHHNDKKRLVASFGIIAVLVPFPHLAGVITFFSFTMCSWGLQSSIHSCYYQHRKRDGSISCKKRSVLAFKHGCFSLSASMVDIGESTGLITTFQIIIMNDITTTTTAANNNINKNNNNKNTYI